MNWSAAETAEGRDPIQTVTSMVPGVPAGEVAVIDVSLLNVHEDAGVPPNDTWVAPVKP